jgi:type IV pilus assembly protein PilW
VDDWNQTTPTTACGWLRAQAVRLVVVARSDKYESKIDTATGQRVCDTVTTAAPTWNGSAGAPILLTGSSWQCYRYQTFENITPTRNVIWMGTQAGC